MKEVVEFHFWRKSCSKNVFERWPAHKALPLLHKTCIRSGASKLAGGVPD